MLDSEGEFGSQVLNYIVACGQCASWSADAGKND